MAYLLQHLLTEAAQRQPDRPAVASGGGLLSYRELDQLSNQVAAALLRQGVAPGRPGGGARAQVGRRGDRALRGAEGRGLLRAARPEGARRAAQLHRGGQRRSR